MPARENDLEVKIVKNWGCGSTFGSWNRQNLHRLRVRTIWKSKALKTESLGRLLEVEVAKICTTPAREHDLEGKTVKAPGSRTTFWGSKWVQSAFRVAGAGISTQHHHKHRYKSLKRIVILRSSVCSTCHISGKSRRKASVSYSQSVSQSVSQPAGQSVSQSVSQWVSRSVSQSVSHSIRQSVSQSSISQSVSQSVSQPVR